MREWIELIGFLKRINLEFKEFKVSHKMSQCTGRNSRPLSRFLIQGCWYETPLLAKIVIPLPENGCITKPISKRHGVLD